MTREEMLRILEFANTTREIASEKTNLSVIDARWNILSYAMQRHLEGKLLTTSSLALAADVPYGTAMRRIGELIDEGLLMKRPRSKTGKSYSLHPTRALISEYEAFATQFKTLVGQTFGFATGDRPIEELYFGGAYMASRILPYPNAMRRAVGFDRRYRVLAPIDPTFRGLSALSNELKELVGAEIEIINLSLDALYQEIKTDAQKPVSSYDLIALDFPWMGEMAELGVVMPLNQIFEETGFEVSDFHNAAFDACAWDGVQYGLPIQPTAELLLCRRDVFEAEGLEIPQTLEALLTAAEKLNRSRMNMSGIVMNFGRGTPVAHSFIQTLADFGQPMIDLKPWGDQYKTKTIKDERRRPLLNTKNAEDAAEFLKALLPFSHPESLKCHWDRRVKIYAEGGAAMTYAWSVRASVVELNESAAAHGHTHYAVHPPKSGLRPVSPIGGYALSIPSQISKERIKPSWSILEYLTRPEMMKFYALNGSLTSPRFSTSSDPEVRAASPVIGLVDRLQREGEIQLWPRPPIPEFSKIMKILGDEIYFILQDQTSVKDALNRAQNQTDALMREAGYY